MKGESKGEGGKNGHNYVSHSRDWAGSRFALILLGRTCDLTAAERAVWRDAIEEVDEADVDEEGY